MATAPTVTISPIVLPDHDIYCNIVAAGASGQDAITFTAISLAESGGNAVAISGLASDGSRGYGLFQIEYPTHADLFAGSSAAGGPGVGWVIPSTNCAMAMKVKAQQGFGAWTTYTTGAYLLLMARALEAQAFTLAASKTGGFNSTAMYIASRVQADTVQLSEVSLTLALAGTLGNAATATAQSAGQAAGSFASLYQGYSGPPAGNPLLRIVEIILGAVLLVAGLKVLTAPVTAPIGHAVTNAAKLAAI